MKLDAGKFLEDLTGKHARVYVQALADMLVAEATGNRVALLEARQRFRDVVRETMGTAEILGASIVLQDTARGLNDGIEAGMILRGDRRRMLVFADAPTQTILPRVSFDEAVQDMIDRTPVTIRAAAERNAQAIAELYGERHVVAFAYSAEAAVTKKVQSLFVEMIREGSSEVDAGARIVKSVSEVRKRSKAWTEGYARMAFGTNVNTAVTAGRFRTARDPAIMKIMPAMQFLSVGDADTRPNHDAADEIVMAVDNPGWARIAPPLGYSCRCDLRSVNVLELRRMGKITDTGKFHQDKVPHNAFPDEGFRHGGRPDILMTEVVR